MKKIQLADGSPTNIRLDDQSEKVKDLTKEIQRTCAASGLSYKEMNKALYLADKGLYNVTLSKAAVLS